MVFTDAVRAVHAALVVKLIVALALLLLVLPKLTPIAGAVRGSGFAAARVGSAARGRRCWQVAAAPTSTRPQRTRVRV